MLKCCRVQCVSLKHENTDRSSGFWESIVVIIQEFKLSVRILRTYQGGGMITSEWGSTARPGGQIRIKWRFKHDLKMQLCAYW